MTQRLLVCDQRHCCHVFSIPLNAPPAQVLALVCPACNQRVSISKKRGFKNVS